MKSKGSGLMRVKHCQKLWRSWQRISGSNRRKSDTIVARLDAEFSTDLMINACRIEQYKKQFKRWNWSKNLSTTDARWMEEKAAKRKREDKDTIFEYHGQTYTTESIQQRLQRRKNQLEETIGLAGMMALCLMFSWA